MPADEHHHPMVQQQNIRRSSTFPHADHDLSTIGRGEPLSELGSNVETHGSDAAEDGDTVTIVVDEPSNQTTGSMSSSQAPLWQKIHHPGPLLSHPTEDVSRGQPSLPGWDPSAVRSSAVHSPNGLSLPSQVSGVDKYNANFMLDTDFGTYGYLTPGVLDLLDFATPQPPSSYTPHPQDRQVERSCDKPEVLFSGHQVQRMRQLWYDRRPASGMQMVRSMWHVVVQYEADNIFSRAKTSQQSCPESLSQSDLNSQWHLDDESRGRMTDFCNELDKNFYHEDLAKLTPQSAPRASSSEAGSGSTLPWSSADGFPTKEILNASLELFFHCSHLPFLHKATFDATSVPEPLLLAVCLLGLSSLHPERSKSFVLRYYNRLMHFCRNDLTTKTVDRCKPWELLVAIATTLLVVYLALGHLEELDESQAHGLTIQMLHVAERHGLFAASCSDDLILQLQATPDEQEVSWKAWCRAESIKRMISCLLWMDLAYARIMGGPGMVDIDKVDLHLPCEAALFDAPSSNRFLLLQAGQHGAQLMMPRMRVHMFHANPPATLTHMSMETLLVALYLQTVAIRHKWHTPDHRARICSHEETLFADGKANGIIASLLLLPSRYAKLFRQRHRVTAFAWNNVCIALTTDLSLLETAAGREGIDTAQVAMHAVTRWSETPRARRAVLHAAQIFDILSSSRFSEWNIARPDLLLFQSALLLSMYLFVFKHETDHHDSPAFELLQDVDWTVVGAEGIGSPTQTAPGSPGTTCSSPSGSGYAARNFIRQGGPISFSGEALSPGGVTARKILLNYVHLLDDIGKYSGSIYSQLLRTMSDCVIE
ncbi:hypothetical protein A1O1_01430 [Capronia coronata CBS 617.96]|uniref:Xylanolytic transcriptional activator regulatory domain-containing protein n=1 Tax=Capronia coronata CBS 617.96 TaxID=1182541 RepID=W9ZP88_9EURO|nr:uncharacterized protein A1O1_01430 [Capronia coronata CBS 617.96]EXJ96304.1 hypothetical protein A1O1_01430 [Capronia coronata CBS 617.96]